MIRIVVMALCGTLLLSGCNLVNDEVSYEKREWHVETISDAYLNAVDEFAVESSREILWKSETNELYSPISLYFALSILANGATNETNAEMLSLLNTEDITKDQINLELLRLTELLNFDSEDAKLNLANSI